MPTGYLLFRYSCYYIDLFFLMQMRAPTDNGNSVQQQKLSKIEGELIASQFNSSHLHTNFGLVYCILDMSVLILYFGTCTRFSRFGPSSTWLWDWNFFYLYIYVIPSFCCTFLFCLIFLSAVLRLTIYQARYEPFWDIDLLTYLWLFWGHEKFLFIFYLFFVSHEPANLPSWAKTPYFKMGYKIFSPNLSNYGLGQADPPGFMEGVRRNSTKLGILRSSKYSLETHYISISINIQQNFCSRT